MAHFILVHGGFHGGWCWEKVAPLLDAAGHSVEAPDLPGMGEDRTPFGLDPFEQWVAAIGALAVQASEPVVLVGHSHGGTVVSQVAERWPYRVLHLVFVTAVLLPPGLPKEAPRTTLAGYIITSEDGTLAWPEPNQAGKILYQKASPIDRAAALARLAPQPTSTLYVLPSLTNDRFGSIPRTYIEAQDDRAVPLAMQRAFQTNWASTKVISLPSDHSPFYSTPQQLAAILMQIT